MYIWMDIRVVMGFGKKLYEEYAYMKESARQYRMSEGKVKDELKEQAEKYLVVSSDLGSL